MKVTDNAKVILAALTSAVLGYIGLVLGEDWAVNFLKAWSVLAGLVGILMMLIYRPPSESYKKLRLVKILYLSALNWYR